MNLLKQIQSMLMGRKSVRARKTADGIGPALFKEHSLHSRIIPIPVPDQLRIPIGCADNDMISLLVEAGDRVRKYQTLALLELGAQNCNEVPAHSSTSGTVTAIETSSVADHSTQEQVCVVISADGLDEPISLKPTRDYKLLSCTELISAIRKAGIPGMGGAGLPAADKIASTTVSTTAKDVPVDLLIINAAECEPCISADEALIRERANKVVAGAEILKQASSASQCIIAIETSKPDAIQALQKVLDRQSDIDRQCELALIPGKYPAESEKQLIYCVSGKEIPSGHLPTQHGVLVHNAGTAYAAYEALAEGKPWISRITTMSGQALKTPKNFEALIGTSVELLFELCEIESGHKFKTVVGGSLMGVHLTNDEAVVCKTTNSLIAASSAEFTAPAETQACIRCGFCADACAAKLLPQQLLAHSKTANTEQLLDHGLLDCIECGACDYVCPSQIPLVSIFKDSKNEIAVRGQAQLRSAHWQKRFQHHQYRIKKDRDRVQGRQTEATKQKRSLEIEVAVSTDAKTNEQEFFSKEKASKEIAAAVARVKARRDESKNTLPSRDKPK